MVKITLAQGLEIIESIKVYEFLLCDKNYPLQTGYGIDGGTGDGYSNGIKYGIASSRGSGWGIEDAKL